MLKRDALTKKLTLLAEKLFSQEKTSNNIVFKAWLELSKNEAFLRQVQQLQNQAVIPSWEGDLCATVKIEPQSRAYTVLAVDGSQIYPDHHMADVGCFLINCGGCALSYGPSIHSSSSSESLRVNGALGSSEVRFNNSGRVCLFSEPEVFLQDGVLPKKYPVNFTPDLVDLKREELEFAMGFEKATKLNQDNKNLMTLFDGSLIFWHLESKPKEVKSFFLGRYLEILERFYHNNLLIAGYLSSPKSRELIRLVKVWLCQHLAPDGTPCKVPNRRCPCCAVGEMVDGQLMRRFLKKGHRTTVFHSHSKIIDSYPEHLKPCFFYLNVGYEIVRIELPAWIAQKRELVDSIGAICLDQSSKGYGYPVSLAEAHEQAVVTSRDREFFYHMIRMLGTQKKRNVLYSQKIIKKRGMKF